jgi:hypothetical protein
MPEQIAQEERRVFRRIPCKLKVQARLSRVTEEGVWMATIRNISVEGIGLMINRPARVGMYLTVELPGKPPVMRKAILVRVTHVRAHTGGQWWNLGGQFVRKLTKDELDFMTTRQPLISPPVERRTTVRLTTRIKTACPLIRATEEGPWWASVRNVSLRGVSLIVNRPFRVGCYATVELPTKAGGLGKSRLLRIRNVRPQPGNQWWVLGCQFLTKLSKEELLEMI